MSDGCPKGFPSTRLESSRPTAWLSPIRDRQDDSFEQQKVSGRLVEVDENSENKLETAGWKGSVELLTPLGSPTRGPQWVTGGCQLDRSETTTTGGCLTISGATPILSVLSAPGWPSCLY